MRHWLHKLHDVNTGLTTETALCEACCLMMSVLHLVQCSMLRVLTYCGLAEVTDLVQGSSR